jgi:Cu/Ag efflux pump CusA
MSPPRSLRIDNSIPDFSHFRPPLPALRLPNRSKGNLPKSSASCTTCSGAVDLYVETITGAPYLEIDVNRTAAARYGISVGDAQDVIETAIGGKNLTFTIEGHQRFPVRVRYARDFREDMEALRNVLVASPTGTPIPLGQIADIRIVTGPSMITSENGLLRGDRTHECAGTRRWRICG